MIFAVVTFVVVFAIIGALYWAFVVRVEAATQRTIDKRIRPEDAARKLKLAVKESELNTRGRGALAGLQALIDRSGLKLTVAAFFFLAWMAGFLVGFTVFVLTKLLIAAVVFGGCALILPYLWVRRAAAARMWKFEEQFPEAIDLISRALRAGHAFPTGLQMVADEIGNPVGPEFKLLYDRQNYGMALPDALRSLAERVPILDARFFVTAVLTQREAGGNLSGVLDNLSSVIRERFKVKRQVKVVSAHGRMTALILMGLPPTVGVFQAIIAPGNFKLLLSDSLGIMMLVAAGVLQLIGMFIISRIVKVEY